MSIDYKQLESDIALLLAAMPSFTPSEVVEVEECLTAGEYGVAFETLCGIVKEERRSVPEANRPMFRVLAERMGIDPIWWLEIADGKPLESPERDERG